MWDKVKIVLKKMLNRVEQSRLTSMVTSGLFLVGGYAVGSGYISKDNVAYFVPLIVPYIVTAIVDWRSSSVEVAVEKATSLAPSATLDKLIEERLQLAMNKMTKVDGVRDIVVDEHYARANPNPKVIGPAEAAQTYSGGTSP